MKQFGSVRVGVKPRYPRGDARPQNDTTTKNMGARKYPLCADCRRLRVSAPDHTYCRICIRRHPPKED